MSLSRQQLIRVSAAVACLMVAMAAGFLGGWITKDGPVTYQTEDIPPQRRSFAFDTEEQRNAFTLGEWETADEATRSSWCYQHAKGVNPGANEEKLKFEASRYYTILESQRKVVSNPTYPADKASDARDTPAGMFLIVAEAISPKQTWDALPEGTLKDSVLLLVLASRNDDGNIYVRRGYTVGVDFTITDGSPRNLARWMSACDRLKIEDLISLSDVRSAGRSTLEIYAITNKGYELADTLYESLSMTDTVTKHRAILGGVREIPENVTISHFATFPVSDQKRYCERLAIAWHPTANAGQVKEIAGSYYKHLTEAYSQSRDAPDDSAAKLVLGDRVRDRLKILDTGRYAEK